MKSELKKILLDLIYTKDSKPRFVGGDVHSKINYINKAISSIKQMYKTTYEDRALEILCVDDDGYTLQEMINSIQEQDKIDGTMLIDYVEGVVVWQKLEYEMTCDEFLTNIGLKE